MKTLLILLGGFFAMPCFVALDTNAQQPMRQWSNRDKSQSIEARFQSYDPKSRKLTLQLSNGDPLTVDLMQLSPFDRRHVVKLNRGQFDSTRDSEIENEDSQPNPVRLARSGNSIKEHQAFGIRWTPGIEAALQQAAGEESVQDDRPVMWLRVLGDLSGFMWSAGHRMRTVTFSEPSVQNLLNRNFVNTYTNTQGDPTAGESFNHRPTDPAGSCIRGNGKQNVQTIFMTPQGKIYHVATGYLSADDLMEESNFALKLFAKIQEQDSSNAATTVAESHRERLKSVGFDEPTINAPSGMANMMRRLRSGNSSPIGKTSIPGVNSQTGNSMPVANMFQNFIERQFLEDNQFSIKFPLISHEQLERDPTRLVGNGKSFFASSSSGNQ